MPQIDWPLETLRSYRGVNPRPDDFDGFWAHAEAGLAAVDPRVSLEPAAFRAPGVECFDLWFDGPAAGGRTARVHAQYLRPANRPGPVPAVVLFHGYSMNAGDWSDKLKWVAAGFAVAAMDCRGQGGLSEDPGGTAGNTLRGQIIRGVAPRADGDPHDLYFRSVFLDAARLVRTVMAFDEVDADRVGVTGASQGGALTLAAAALVPEVRLAAPVYPFLCDYKRVWDMDLDQQAYAELREYFQRFDPTHEREDELFRKLGYIDCVNLAPRIRARTMMATALLDEICPPSTQFAAYNAITAEKDMVLYPDFGHERLPGWEDRLFAFMLGLSG